MCGVPTLRTGHGAFASSLCGQCCLPPEIFSRPMHSVPPVTLGFVTLVLMVCTPVTLRCLLRGVKSPVSGSMGKLRTTLTSLHELEKGPSLESVTSECPLAGLDFLSVSVEQVVKTKVVAHRQFLQWCTYLVVALL